MSEQPNPEPGKAAGTFLGGAALLVAGLYLMSRHVILHSGFPSLFWGIPFGLTMVPLLIGIGFLFFNAKSLWGWGLSVAGVIIIVAEVLVSIELFLKPMTLYEGVLIFGMIAAGAGLLARALKQGVKAPSSPPEGEN